ncbi:diguanylate cyclase domain-containing protein [Zavarzinia sp.]|uniref:diguanylate cyclase domain-containing protein n=1 Tax=Zavarzinia sp. TaxID=2027920 RepID=UPI003BB7E762
MDERRQQTQSEIDRSLVLTSKSAALQMESVIREVDFVLQDLRTQYQTDRASFPAAVRRIETLFASNSTLSLWIMDADGRNSFSSVDERASVNASEREYFRRHRDGGGQDILYISAPLIGQYSGQWTVILSRRLENAGTFAGTIVLAVPPSYFSSRLGAADITEELSVIHLPDGIIMATNTGADLIGQVFADTAWLLGPRARPSGIVHKDRDGPDRIVAWQRIGGSPLAVTASADGRGLRSRTEAAIDAELRAHMITTVLALVLIGGVGVVILRDVGLRQRLHRLDILHKQLFDAMPDGMMVIDQSSNITLWNEAALSLLAVDSDELKARVVALYDMDGKRVPVERYPSMQASRRPGHHGLFSIQDHGQRRWLSFNSRPIPNQDGEAPDRAILAFSDVTRLVQLEDSMRTSQSVFEAAGEGIMVTGADQRIISVNPAFTRITGYAAHEAQGRVPGELLGSGQHDEEFYEQMHESLRLKGYWEGEITNRRKDGNLFIEWLKINVVRDEQGQVLRYVALLSDISERKRQDQEIWKRANFDALTGLPNRTLFTDRLNQAVSQADRRHARVAVFFIDLDKFKAVNDTLGHKAGDDLLLQVAERLQANIRSEDTAARIGGDEFLVLQPQAGDDTALLLAGERIREALCQPFDIGGNTVQISASIGIADALGVAADPAQAIKRADAAMYRAKSSGANRVVML